MPPAFRDGGEGQKKARPSRATPYTSLDAVDDSDATQTTTAHRGMGVSVMMSRNYNQTIHHARIIPIGT